MATINKVQSTLLEWQDILGRTQSATATEWWNGEGIDFHFDDKPVLSLHMDELAQIVIASSAFGMIDLIDCDMKANEIKHED